MTYGWLWMFIGLGLMVLELAAPGFVIFFFGLGAAAVGLLCFALGSETFPMVWQISAFLFFSILFLVALRRLLKKVFMGDRKDGGEFLNNEYVGRTGRVTEAVNPPLTGRVEIGDAEWTATSDTPLAVGTAVKVISQNNLTMKIEEIK